MFGLRNFRGSCWVNATLQCIFRIPEVQDRYNNKRQDESNNIDVALSVIWESKGRFGLQQFYNEVHSELMPAGRGTGDSHELLQYLCDKVPFLDTLVRYNTEDHIECETCKKLTITKDSVIEFPIHDNSRIALTTCIANTVSLTRIPDWKCDDCKGVGCKKRTYVKNFPRVMVFHMKNTEDNFVEFTPILILNKIEYALVSVTCYNGSHWWGYGRDMPPGSSWHTLDDTHVTDNGASKFPRSPKTRLLIYYRNS